MSKVVIRSEGPACTTKLEVDGREVLNCVEYSITQNADGLPVPRMEIFVTELAIETEEAIVTAGVA